MKWFIAIFSIIVLPKFTIGQFNTEKNIYKNSIQNNLITARELIKYDLEDSALVYLNAVLAKKYNEEEALLLRARVYNNKNKYLEALTDYNALLSINPENKEVLYSRGIVRYNLEQYELAIEDFSMALKFTNKETNTAFFKIDPGSNLASGIFTISGMNSNIWNNIGLSYLALDKFDEALASFSQGIKEDNQALDLIINRARTYEKIGEHDLAVSDYNYVLSKDPTNSIARHNLMNLKKTELSENDQLLALNAFIDENPGLAQGYSSRGLFYYERMNYQAARSDFENALEIQPENTDYLFNFALCLEKLQNYQKATDVFLQITEIDPTHSGAYFNLGNLHFKQEEYETAISFYTIANNLNPKNISILYNRALAYHALDQDEKACIDMEKVKEADLSLAEPFFKKFCKTAQ